MNKMKSFAVCSLFIGSTVAVACVGTADTGQVLENDGVALSAIGLGHPNSNSNGNGNGNNNDHQKRRRAESSPYVVGDWKFDQKDCNGESKITADSEFRFINPTARQFTIEYAFFDLGGNFCGCDREDIHPNETIVYTIAQEIEEGLFVCNGKSGTVKSIFFNIKDGKLDLDDAEQVGFQTHAFAFGSGEIKEPDPMDPTDFLVGPVMTESGLKGVAINPATFQDILDIHTACANFPPLQGN